MAQSEAINCSMNGGSGQYSYSKNSNFQKKAIDAAKELIRKGVTEKFDADIVLSSSNTLRIADLGCAAGPNTFFAVQNIIDSVEEVLKTSSSSSSPDIQVFFNDQASNDFNQLFASLPERRYFAAGVPGSFHGRLFPRGSLHLVHSSYSVQILSRVPREVLDEASPAWNKGRIHYSGSAEEVVRAYVAQYAEDMDVFLRARAEEIVPGGLMAFVVPGSPNGTPHSQCLMCSASDILGSCFVDLANKGRISHEKVDSFNLPTYFASLEEVEAIVNGNGSFQIETMENITNPKLEPKAMATTIRAGMGALMGDHFGQGFDSDEFFDLLANKFQENYSVIESAHSVSLFVLLKRI